MHTRLKGEYTIVFDVDMINQIGGSVSVNIKNACDDNLLNESFELYDQNIFTFEIPPCNHLTYVPDDNLESVIESSFYLASNGQTNDNYVKTIGLIAPSYISTPSYQYEYIFIENDNEFGPIFDVTGLENLILPKFSKSYYRHLLFQVIWIYQTISFLEQIYLLQETNIYHQ